MTSTPTRSKARSARREPGKKAASRSRSSPVKDQLGVTILAHDETVRGDTTMQTLAALNPSFEQHGRRWRSTTW